VTALKVAANQLKKRLNRWCGSTSDQPSKLQKAWYSASWRSDSIPRSSLICEFSSAERATSVDTPFRT